MHPNVDEAAKETYTGSSESFAVEQAFLLVHDSNPGPAPVFGVVYLQLSQL